MSNIVKVYLTLEETLLAAAVGFYRQEESMKKGLKDAHGYNGKDAWETHIMGAQAEQAVAKYLGVPWSESVNTFGAPDIDPDIQVRTFKNPEDPYLLVRPNDKDKERFVAVYRIDQFTYKIFGWMYGKDAKKKEWIRDPNNRGFAYFVPFENLTNISDLLIE